MQGDNMKTANSKTQTNLNSHIGNSLEGVQSLRLKCPLCDTRRSGPCNHSGILNLKGNKS